jgi:hypothetical protein
MGTYEVHIPNNTRLGRKRAVGIALGLASAERIFVAGRPKVRVERSVPVIGTRRGYRVTFPKATHWQPAWRSLA